ncbi:MAG: hypothetical protein ACPLRX_10575, partial [Candidatus Saccharicenans sp.]
MRDKFKAQEMEQLEAQWGDLHALSPMPGLTGTRRERALHFSKYSHLPQKNFPVVRKILFLIKFLINNQPFSAHSQSLLNEKCSSLDLESRRMAVENQSQLLFTSKRSPSSQKKPLFIHKDCSYIPQHIPQHLPRHLPQHIPQHIHHHLPQHIHQHLPQHIPQHISKHLPQHLLQYIPQHLPQNILQHISHHIPQLIPQHVPQYIPRHSPEGSLPVRRLALIVRRLRRHSSRASASSIFSSTLSSAHPSTPPST